jgi:hypothetical protein
MRDMPEDIHHEIESLWTEASSFSDEERQIAITYKQFMKQVLTKMSETAFAILIIK